MTTGMFYISRKKDIDERLNLIYFSTNTVPAGGTDTPITRLLEDTYYRWHGRSARGIDWSRWKIGELQEIALCLGGPVLALICERFATDFRFTHSGLPDLLLWDPATQRAKLVEVKGPGDSLSEKQIIWIDALARRGCNIVTLYVKKEEEEKESTQQQFGDEITELLEDIPATPVNSKKRGKRTATPASSKKKKAKEELEDEEE